MFKERIKPKEIAERLDRNRRTIEREITKGMVELKKIFRSITVDNGSEFLDYEGLEQSIMSKKKRTQIYYAHPYSTWERGTNENINKMIRRFIPKGSDISNYSDEEIKRIETWINNYPRKILGYYSVNEIYELKVA